MPSLGLAVDRTDRLAGLGKGRIRAVDLDLREQGRNLPARQLIAQRLLDQIADHSFAFGAQDIERIRAHVLVGRRLQGQQSDLRTVAVGDDDLVPSRDWRHRLGDSVQQIASLHLCVERLAAAQERVAAKRHDHEHQLPLPVRECSAQRRRR